MKHLIAYIFLIIFSTQMLPVKEIGKILFKGSMTEEIHETSETTPDETSKLKKGTEFFKYSETTCYASLQFFSKEVLTALHRAESLPKDHVPDIFAPPPNCA